MAQSLVKLTLESNQYEAGLREAKKSWEDFTKGIGMSVSKFTAVTAAVGAVTGALKVAKDAFKINEEAMDEWGRTTEAAGALYDGFLRSLNSGDISGYLTRIDEITQAARDAYDALDELGTFNAFNQINTQRTRTKFTEDYAGYRTGDVSKEQVQASAKAYQDELRERRKLEQDAYEKSIAEFAAKMGVARGNLEQVLSEYNYKQFQELKAIQPSKKRTVFSAPTPYGVTSYEEAVPANETEKIADALRKLTDEELQSLQALGAQAQRTGEEIAQVDKQLARVLNSKTKDKTDKTSKTKTEQTELQKNQKEINKLEQEYIKLGDESNEGARERQAEIKKEIELLRERNGLLELRREQANGRLLAEPGDFRTDNIKTSGSLFAPPNDKKDRGQDGKLKLQLDQRSMKSLTKNIEKSLAKQENRGIKTVGEIGNIAGDISGVLSGLEQMGIDIPDGIKSVLGAIQVVTSIMSTISTIVMFIAARSSIPFFSQGGVVHAAGGYKVPGNFLSNDKVPALLNSGELVLNRAQQGVLATALQTEHNTNSYSGDSFVSGETIWLGLKNYLKRTGMGEIVTTGR